MDRNWFVDIILPGLFHSSERIRNCVQICLKYSENNLSLSLPNLVYLHLEGQKKKEISHSREIVREETSLLYSNICEKYCSCPIASQPFELKALTFLVVSDYFFIYQNII